MDMSASSGWLPAVAPNSLTAEERETGFRLLFDGRTTNGWRGYRQEGFPEQGWVVEGGALVHRAGEGGGDIVTDEQFTDFELRFEWAVTEGANSGVIYRVAETGQQTYETGPEYQVFDDRGRSGTKTSAAALYGLVAPRSVKLAPVGEFNTGRVIVRNGRIAHWLNGVEVLQCPIEGAQWEEMIADSKFARWAGFGRQPSGHIALQDHGNTMRYRSIRIRSFPAAEPASVRKRQGEHKEGDSR